MLQFEDKTIIKPFSGIFYTKFNNIRIITENEKINLIKGFKTSKNSKNQINKLIKATRVFFFLNQEPTLIRFATFTFTGKIKEPSNVFRKFLQNQNRNIKNYIYVVEPHANGGYHIHALISFHKKPNYTSLANSWQNVAKSFGVTPTATNSYGYIRLDKLFVLDKNKKPHYIKEFTPELLKKLQYYLKKYLKKSLDKHGNTTVNYRIISYSTEILKTLNQKIEVDYHYYYVLLKSDITYKEIHLESFTVNILNRQVINYFIEIPQKIKNFLLIFYDQ